jgi:uncharacterized repeat protein (TIGR03803 family)
MRTTSLSIGLMTLLAVSTVTLLCASAGAQQETILHSFSKTAGDGAFPTTSLLLDASGNLYGSASGGKYSSGMVFELTPTEGGSWSENILYNFDGKDGFGGPMIFDASGNLFGASYVGGPNGGGDVFELTSSPAGGWTEQVLHSFSREGSDRGYVSAGVIFDASGNLYGTTAFGGPHGSGSVYELSPASGGGWTSRDLYIFPASGLDGFTPYAGVTFDRAGNLYGTTYVGGAFGAGTVYELSPTAGGGWIEKVIYSFNDHNYQSGYYPSASLLIDASGNLYSTTTQGGPHKGGTVFELSPTSGGGWTQSVLYGFGAGKDGSDPSGVIFDAAGNLYGTTMTGGTYGYGTVFELSPHAGGSWIETILYEFGSSTTDGVYPEAGLVRDASGNLYGTTHAGGVFGYGTVFEITP